jgi:membrane protease subunit HflC
MNRKFLIGLGVALVAAVILATSSLFVVNQAEQVIVLQFGEPKRVIRDPGLKLKVPFIQNTDYDKRLQPRRRGGDRLEKRLVIDAYARPSSIRCASSDDQAEALTRQLGATISGSLRRVIGAWSLSDERSRIAVRVDVNRRRPTSV